MVLCITSLLLIVCGHLVSWHEKVHICLCKTFVGLVRDWKCNILCTPSKPYSDKPDPRDIFSVTVVYHSWAFPKALLSNNNLFLGSNLLLVSFPWSFQVCRSMCDQISGCCCCSINEPDFPPSPQNCTLPATSTTEKDIRKTSELVNIWGPFTQTNKD